MPTRSLDRFFFPVESDRWLAVLRVGLGVELVLYCLGLAADWFSLFSAGSLGMVRRDLGEAVLSTYSPFLPRFGWLVGIGKLAHLNEATVLWMVWAGLVCAALLLIAGFCCRAAAVAAWFLYLSSVKSATLLSYGMDNFTTIGLFYLMLLPFPDRFSVDHRCRRQKATSRYQYSGFMRRVLQVHLCFVYGFGGLGKALGAGWWNGESIWRALNSPPLDMLSPQLIASVAPVLPALGVGVVLLELGYPVLIWPSRTQTAWLFAIVSMHIGIALAMGLYGFSFVMIVLNLAGFGKDTLLEGLLCWTQVCRSKAPTFVIDGSSVEA